MSDWQKTLHQSVDSLDKLKAYVTDRFGAEVAEREGCRARLVDDETGIDPEWLHGAHTVGLTAGASAPEVLVERVIEALGDLGPVDVEERQVVTESMRFTLPVELRRPGENGWAERSSRVE